MIRELAESGVYVFKRGINLNISCGDYYNKENGIFYDKKIRDVNEVLCGIVV